MCEEKYRKSHTVVVNQNLGDHQAEFALTTVDALDLFTLRVHCVFEYCTRREGASSERLETPKGAVGGAR